MFIIVLSIRDFPLLRWTPAFEISGQHDHRRGLKRPDFSTGLGSFGSLTISEDGGLEEFAFFFQERRYAQQFRDTCRQFRAKLGYDFFGSMTREV